MHEEDTLGTNPSGRLGLLLQLLAAISHLSTNSHALVVCFSRHHLIALGVAVDILGCTGTVSQRASVLHKVIQLAQALKEHAHDLYSFSAVMKALEMPQVSERAKTWLKR